MAELYISQKENFLADEIEMQSADGGTVGPLDLPASIWCKVVHLPSPPVCMLLACTNPNSI